MKKWWILFLLVFITLSQSRLGAEVYTLGEQNISLPFEKSWLAKTDKPKSNLLFFDPKLSNPRPIVQVALSAFTYPQDLSAFIERYQREKKIWVNQQSGKLVEQIKDFSDKKTRLVYFEMHFSIPVGEFYEWSVYQQCKSDQSISLKMMVPIESESMMRVYWNQLLKSGLCT